MTEPESSSFRSCPFEPALEQALESNHWDASLLAHIEGCATCAELELVARSMKQIAALDSAPAPDPNLMWWRAQVRAREESMRRATRPIHILERLAIPLLSIGGLALVAALWPSISDSLRSLELLTSQVTRLLLLSLGAGTSLLVLFMTFGIALVWAED